MRKKVFIQWKICAHTEWFFFYVGAGEDFNRKYLHRISRLSSRFCKREMPKSFIIFETGVVQVVKGKADTQINKKELGRTCWISKKKMWQIKNRFRFRTWNFWTNLVYACKSSQSLSRIDYVILTSRLGFYHISYKKIFIFFLREKD